jgi:hypothetical protein
MICLNLIIKFPASNLEKNIIYNHHYSLVNQDSQPEDVPMMFILYSMSEVYLRRATC